MSEFFLILKRRPEEMGQNNVMMDIIAKRPVDLSGFEVSLANQLSHLIHEYKHEIAEYIFNIGYSNFLSMGVLNEDVITKGTPVAEIYLVLEKYLDKLGIDNELIIVDPFFFAPTRVANYDVFVANVLDKYLAGMNTLIFITGSRVDPALKSAVEARLLAKNSALNIIHNTSNDYHDRYWISGAREKGVLMGTSLNGLGNKLALIDRLNTSDVREIVKALIADGLV